VIRKFLKAGLFYPKAGQFLERIAQLYAIEPRAHLREATLRASARTRPVSWWPERVRTMSPQENVRRCSHELG